MSGLIIDSGISEVLFAVVFLLSALYYYFTSKFDQWKKLGVPYIKPTPFFGNAKDLVLVRRTRGDLFQDFYNSEELKDAPFGGVFLMRNPVLVARDLDFIKDVMIKDFKYFSDRGIPFDEKTDPLQAHLFSLGGWRWRVLRMKLTPTFTSGKMKTMFNTMAECTTELDKILMKHAANNSIIEIKEELAKFTTDIIGSCAFGLQFNAMENENSEFRAMGRRIFTPRMANSIKQNLVNLFPFLRRFFRLLSIDKDVSDFFLNAVSNTVKYREENKITRNDMLQLLIEIKNQGAIVDEENKYHTTNAPTDESGHQVLELDNNLMAAQVFVFFLAGFETSSTTMSFACYELARNPEIQDRAAEEVRQVLEKYNGKVTYDGLQEMKYLDMIISETLRMYPPVTVLFRRATQSYKPQSSSVVIPEDTRVFIPIYAIHHDPKYFPEPKVFDPDRFLPEKKAKMHPMVYMPFGEGPRNCIGSRFGLLQTKLGLATILRNYKLDVCEKTPIPMKLDPRAVVTTCEGGSWFRISCRE